MRRHIATTLTAPALLLAVTACGAAEAKDTDERGESAVPAGVTEMYTVLEEELADRGGTVESGDWTVSYIVESAEPWFEEHQGHGLRFRDPAQGETHHVEIIPREKETGRIIPDVPITVEIVDQAGKVVAKTPLTFYYSTFFHYADNVSVPAGDYTIRATLGAPGFKRHGAEDEAPALAQGVTVEFEGVTFKKG